MHLDHPRRSGLSLSLALAALAPITAAQCPQGMFLASDGEDLLNYGSAIAVDGNRALIGAAGHVTVDGRGYVMQRVSGQWQEDAILFPSDDLFNSNAAAAVALDGNVAVLGAPLDDTNGVGNAGSVYVFERTNGTWVETAKLIEPTVQPNNRFGASLALDGDLLFVGAPGAGVGNPGLVHIFQRTGSWASASLIGTLTAADAQNNDSFGTAMDLDGDQLVVGATQEDGIGPDTGAVYVFERPGGEWGTAVSSAKLTAALPEDRENLGYAVTIRGDRILGGAPGDGASDAGVVYSWDRVGGSWLDATETGSMRPSIVGGLRLGQSVALLGDVAYAGGTTSLTGSVRRFLWDGSQWVDELPITPPGAQSGAAYGSALAFDGSELWVGAKGHRENGPRVGSVFRITPRHQTNYCVGAPNSDGGGARISACGSTSVAANGLLLVVGGGVRGVPGIFFYGADQAQVPFGDGFRCVGAPIFRLFPAANSDDGGGFLYDLDVNSAPANQGPGAITAGSTWNFQYWYRDPFGPGGTAFNLSDAVAVTFTP